MTEEEIYDELMYALEAAAGNAASAGQEGGARMMIQNIREAA